MRKENVTKGGHDAAQPPGVQRGDNHETRAYPASCGRPGTDRVLVGWSVEEDHPTIQPSHPSRTVAPSGHGATTGRRAGGRRIVQGVIKSYDPGTGDGVLVRESDLAEFDLADGALDGSIFRMLRQGQRVLFDLDGQGRATHLSLGSEVDMGTPDLG